MNVEIHLPHKLLLVHKPHINYEKLTILGIFDDPQQIDDYFKNNSPYILPCGKKIDWNDDSYIMQIEVCISIFKIPYQRLS